MTNRLNCDDLQKRIEVLEQKTTSYKHLEKDLLASLRYEKALAKCSQILLESKATELAIDQTLEILVIAAQVCRVYIFENFMDETDGLCMRHTYEKCAPGIKAEIDNPLLQHIPYSLGISRWKKAMQKGTEIQGLVETFPEAEREILESQDIKTLLAIPIFIGTAWYGFIGFDITTKKREWKQDEIRLLRTVARMIGAYYERQQVKKSLEEERNLLQDVLNNLPDEVALKDTKSQFIMVNDAVVKALKTGGTGEIIGKSDFDFLPKKIASAMSSEEQEIIQSGIPVLDQEKCVDSGKRWTLTSKLPIYSKDKHVSGILIVNREITKLKQTEEELINYRDRLEKLVEERTGELFKSEQMLQEKSAELQMMLDLSPAMIFYKNRALQYVRINKTFTEFWKFTYDNLVNKTNEEILPELSRISAPSDKQVLETGKPVENQIEKIVFNGEGKWIQFDKYPILGPDNVPTGLIGFAIDVTKRIIAENEINRAKEYAELLFEFTPSAIFTVNTDQIITSWNKKTESVTGYTRDEMIGRHCHTFTLYHCNKGCILFKKPFDKPILNAECKIRHKNGEELTILKNVNILKDKDGKTVGGIESFEDITLNKKSEAALKESEIKYRSVVERANDSIIIVRDGKIVYSNYAVERQFGYFREELENTNVMKFIHPNDRKNVISLYKNLLAGLETPEYFEASLLDKEGNIKYTEVSIGPISYMNKPSQLIIIRDITERKNIEQVLIQSEKMVSIGTLAAGIAHEINNPISYIHLNLDTLQEYAKGFNSFFHDIQGYMNKCISEGSCSPEDMKLKFSDFKQDHNIDFFLSDIEKAVNASLEGSKKVQRIISDLKDFSRKEKPHLALTNINEELDKALNMVWNEVKYKADVIKAYGDLPLVECDAGRLCQVFINLLVNAAHSMEKYGKITIKTFKYENSVQIKISDTGKGIAPGNINKIFDAFFTTKSPGKGTGLGLSISYKIIKDHNGIIDVESIPGKGSTFIVKLPEVQSDVLNEYKVLVVDDDNYIRQIIKSLVIKYNPLYSVRIAKDGFEAANLLNKFKPDLILLDVVMPGMDGVEVCKKIKADPHLFFSKVVFVSSLEENELKKKLIEADAFSYLQKPVDIKKLYKLLDSIKIGMV